MKLKHIFLIVLLVVPFTSLAGEWYYGYGPNPETAMRNAIARAIAYSPAKCLGKDNKPNIEKHCEYAGKGKTYVDKNGNELGPYECKAEGSNHKGSCG